jgi:Xaa-Pro aminopeptidase
MDVHEVGLYRVAGQSRTLEPGMVLTAEPEICIASTMTKQGIPRHRHPD